jgi:hypothetical protein
MTKKKKKWMDKSTEFQSPLVGNLGHSVAIKKKEKKKVDKLTK